jgi:hypothetical protein
MLTKRLTLAAGAAILVAGGATTASAHHSFGAEFDASKPINIEGVVVEFQWVNPHSWLIVDAEKEDGTVERWAIEGGAPSPLLRRGWTRDTLPAGTRVQVRGSQAKDGSLRAAGGQITFPDGNSLNFGSTGIGAAPDTENN